MTGSSSGVLAPNMLVVRRFRGGKRCSTWESLFLKGAVRSAGIQVVGLAVKDCFAGGDDNCL